MSFHILKLHLEKAEETEIKFPTSAGSLKKQESSRKKKKKIYFCFIDQNKAFDYVDHHKLWETVKEMGISEHLTCLQRNLYAGQEVIIITDMEKQTGSKSEKEYFKAVYCYPTYLTYM